MSGENVEIVRRMYEAYLRGDAETDARLERDLHQVWTVSDGLIVRLEVFKTMTEALEAVGLGE